MISSHSYATRSSVRHELTRSTIGLASDTLREPTYFRGRVRDAVRLREALAALHAVVFSDFKYRPKERLEYRAWLEEQDRKFLERLGRRRAESQARLELLEARREELERAQRERLAPFHRARRDFFEYIYENEYELQYLLDPVISVHPDELAFEAFSRDESLYARVGVDFDRFEAIDAFECGTTNIDFSALLLQELERMRSYRSTELLLGPQGLKLSSLGSEAVEKKIDLPESWVQGFLQVQSAMCLGLTRLRASRVDLFNVCRALRREHARRSPRALRYELEPGRPVRVVLEPWERGIEFAPASIYEGPKPQVIRTWGRDRLQVLERLLPLAESVDVYLAGFGLPSVYVLHLGGVRFTLALSGWTDNDWAAGQAKFHLLARTASVSGEELARADQDLRQTRRATPEELAQRLGFGVEKARGALSYLCQAGRAMLDLGGGVYRRRDLFAASEQQPFPAQAEVQPSKEESHPQAKQARAIFEAEAVRVIARRPVSTGHKVSGSARGADGQRVRPLVHLDAHGAVLDASCTCQYFRRHQLTLGPCEHILALRLAFLQQK